MLQSDSEKERVWGACCGHELGAKRVGEVPDRRLITRQEQTTEQKDKDLSMLEKDKDQATIQALQKRLRERERSLTERDRQIEIMASQCRCHETD